MKWDFDDKDLVIFAVTIIAVFSMFAMPSTASNIVGNVVSGLFGVAVGRAIK